MSAENAPIPQPETARRPDTPGNALALANPGVKQRRPQRLPRSLSVDERQALLAQPNGRALTGCRDRALMATMLLAGLRCAEALTLRPRDVDFTGYRIRVFGKGSKERVVPIDPQLEAHLQEWRTR